jgi:hypothetical protein
MPTYTFSEEEAHALRILCDREIVHLSAHGFRAADATISARNKLNASDKRAPDSPRYCSYCQNYGDHHSDRHVFAR